MDVPTALIHQLMPGTGSALAPVLDLFGATVAGVEVSQHGTLRMTFTDTAELLVEPDKDYESWQLSGGGIDGILIGPGGETDW